jgi:hypothetical protein
MLSEQQKNNVLKQIGSEFNITVLLNSEPPPVGNSIQFRKKLTFPDTTTQMYRIEWDSLWKIRPQLANIRHIMRELSVEFDGSETDKLCRKFASGDNF